MSSIPGQGWSKPSNYYKLGRGLAVPNSLHSISRSKLVNILSNRGIQNGILLFKGGEESFQYDTDGENLFKQDSWFNYLFGKSISLDLILFQGYL